MVAEERKRMRPLALGLFACLMVVLFSGCVGSPGTGGDNIQELVERCVQLCREYRGDKSNGPCLSNNLSRDWVCDIAHDPRLPVDNNPENQCPAFGRTAHHFVEVDEDCNLIRYY